MKKLILLTYVSLFGFAAVASEYRKILTCEGGSVVLDQNLNHTKIGQIVIKDKNAINFFISQGVIVESKSLVYPAAENELILTGTNDQRLDSASAFHGFQGYVADRSNYHQIRLTGFARHNIEAYVYRENGGLKVKFEEHRAAVTYCDSLGFQSSGECSKWVSLPEERFERANWFFRDCNAVQ